MSIVTDYAAMILHSEREGRLLAEAEAGRRRGLARAARKYRNRNAPARTGGTDTTENNGSAWVRAA